MNNITNKETKITKTKIDKKTTKDMEKIKTFIYRI